MVDEVLLSDPKLSVFELSPTLIPYFVGFFVFRGFFNNFPLYLQLKENLSENQTVNLWAIISGVALFIGAITRLPAGLLSDKIGRIRAFMFAYSVYIVALLIILLSNGSILYIIGMSMVRLGVNTIAMTGRSVVSTAKRDRALKNGVLSSMVGLGSFLGPYSLGYILDHFEPDMIIYATFAIVALDMLLFFVVYAYVNRSFDQNDLERDLSYAPVDNSRFESFWEALNTEGVREIFFLFFSAGFVYGLVTQIYAIYGYNVLLLSTTTIGLITGLGSLVQTFWAPTVGKLYEYIKDEYFRIAAWVIITIGAVCAALSPISIVFFIASFFVLNFGNSTYFTIEITRMSKLIKSQFSLIFGIATSLIILATSITGFISSFLYDIFPVASFYLSVVVALFGLIVVLSFTPRWKRHRALRNTKLDLNF